MQYGTGIYIICNFFRTFIIFRFLNLFFYSTRDDEKTIKRIVFWSYAFINSGIYLLIDEPIITFLTNIFLYLALTCTFRGKWQVKMVAGFAVLAMGILCEGIVFRSALLGGYSQENALIITYVLSDFLFYTIVLIIERLFDIKSGMEVSFVGGASIVIIPILTAIMDIYLLSVSINELLNITIVCGLFVINILFFYFYQGEIYRNNLEYEKRLLENQNNAYEEQINIIQESEENMKKLRHDYKNHFYSIHTILEEIDNEDIKEYLANMNKFINRSETRVVTGNSKLDSMLNYKINVIKNMGVTTEIDLQIPKDIEISLFDITVIFGNLFDNVIEALYHIENGFFMLKGRYEKNTLYFLLKNSFDGKITRQNGVLKSTKKNPSKHGIGLKNVETILNKYKGNLEIDFDEKYFYTRIFIHK